MKNASAGSVGPSPATVVRDEAARRISARKCVAPVPATRVVAWERESHPGTPIVARDWIYATIWPT